MTAMRQSLPRCWIPTGGAQSVSSRATGKVTWLPSLPGKPLDMNLAARRLRERGQRAQHCRSALLNPRAAHRGVQVRYQGVQSVHALTVTTPSRHRTQLARSLMTSRSSRARATPPVVLALALEPSRVAQVARLGAAVLVKVKALSLMTERSSSVMTLLSLAGRLAR